MAEPARRLDNEGQSGQVYDTRHGTDPSSPKPDLKALEGGGETTPPKRGHLRETGSNEMSGGEDLSSAERSAGETSSDGNTARHENQVGRGYKPGEPLRSRFSLRGRLTKKRALFGGGILGLIISLMLFFFVSGPLQFLHLSQILQKSFSRSENTLSIRSRGLIRYAKTGNIEETRLSKLGSTIYNKTLSQMEDQGITFKKNSRGVPDKMRIDTNQNDNYKDLPNAERENAIIQDFQIKDPAIISEVHSLGSGIYDVELTNTSLEGISFVKALSKTAIKQTVIGKLQQGLAMRYLKEAWDLPNLWSPIDKAKAVIKNNLSSPAAEEKQAQQDEESRLRDDLSEVADTTEADAAKAGLSDALKQRSSLIGRTVIATAFACAIRNAANAAVIVNRAMIVAPAAIQAADKIAIGSQIQSGQNFESSQLTPIASGFTDPATGKSIWSGRALEALSGNQTANGPDLLVKYRQAFSSDTTADNIKNDVNIFGITGLICSKVGTIVQIALGGLVLLVNLPDSEAGAEGYFAAIYSLAKTAIGFGGIIYAIEHFGPALISDKAIVPAIMSGPLGGNLMAFGSRELANIGARSLGGVALPNTDSTTLTYAEQTEQNQQFASENIAKRLFDPYDYRSAISQLIDKVGSSPQGIVASLGKSLTHFGSIFANSLSFLAPKASASSQPYDWGFPQFGFSDSLVNSPEFQDPYTNADAVGEYLDATCLSNGVTNTGCGPIQKAMTCFGVSIDKDTGAWEVVANADVNPDTGQYTHAGCDDTSDSWTRLRMFILDSRSQDTIACQQGVEQSCVNLDEANVGSGGADGSGTAGGSLTNPFPNGWTPSRLDMGYDGHFTNRVVSPCDGKVTYSVNSQGPGSWEGYYFVIQCSASISGLPSNAFYFAEGLTPTVQKGDSVTAGQKIAVPGPTGFSEGPGGIEWGLADSSNPGNALAESGINGMTNCSQASKNMVLSFAQWVEQNLGVAPPASTDHAGCA